MQLEEKLRTGGFVVFGEMEPPKGADFSRFLKNASLVKGRIDALVVPEMANAVMKACSLAGCAFLQSRGFETIMQACCRDRNRLALQADILGASALGVSAVMAVPGEDIVFGDHPRAREVKDLDIHQLLAMLQTLAQGRDLSDVELEGTPPSLLVGSVFNAGASGGALDMELEALEKKIGLGVRFIVTSPVFDEKRLEVLLKRIDTSKVSVIPTVLLLKSAGMARYIDRNIRHISIPAETIQAIQKAGDKAWECVRTAAGLVSSIREMGFAGVSISTVGWEGKLPWILDAVRS
ncbi:MAG TPA: 5,10-methylenetetrahydrofolate reductase [Desulfobacteraceae bacterium]|nr:5,10-methylenetetrahydrofolate reductase [Desulfobacteraceae bacterium]